MPHLKKRQQETEAMSNKTRLRKLEISAAEQRQQVFLNLDELPVKIVLRVCYLAKTRQAGTTDGDAARMSVEKRLRFQRGLERAFERWNEIRREGRLQAAFDGLERKGVWRDEWDNLLPAGDTGDEPTSR
ncbi:MAG TPA: hypothetical protein VNH11_27805 [Pirellulales bacterium]|nr:hypothetical protein [Pirellulales bacterium]